MTLTQYISDTLWTGKVKQRYGEARIVEVSPHVKKGESEEKDEIYYKQQLVLHKPFRNIANLKQRFASCKRTFEAVDIQVWSLNRDAGNAGKDDEGDEPSPSAERDPSEWHEFVAALSHQIPIEVPLGYRVITS